MKKLKIFLALLLIAAMMLSGCSGAQATDRLSVWLIVKSTETEFWKAAFAGAKAAQAEYDVQLSIRGPATEEDYATQNFYIRDAVRSDADAIVFSAISYEENAEAINEAAESGVRIVVIDSDVNSDRVAVRIGTDNVEAGRMAGETVLSAPEEDLYVGIINYSAATWNGQEREKGLREVLEDPRIQNIITINVPTSAAAAKSETEKLLEAHPEINALVALNEPLSVGAAQAVDALQLQDRVHLVAFDTNVECIDYMQTGAVSALVVQNPYAMGYLGVEAACRTGGKRSEDFINTPAVVVTKETMFTPEGQKLLFPFG